MGLHFKTLHLLMEGNLQNAFQELFEIEMIFFV